MRSLAAFLLAALVFQAQADPALHGTWSSASVNGRPLVVLFEAGGAGMVNGRPMRWQAQGRRLVIEQDGESAAYRFEVKDGRLAVSGGDLQGVATLTRGTSAADTANRQAGRSASTAGQAATSGQELVGKWCNAAQFSANNRGGSSRMECFQLNADGTYTYRYEGSMSANAPGLSGGSASQSADSGRWHYDGRQLAVRSRNGKAVAYRLEKRNHPKNKRDPMICLDGTCYVTFYNKPAW